MEADSPFLSGIRFFNICTGQGGVLNGIVSLSFFVAFLLFLGLVLVVWRHDRHRKTDKGLWRGLVFDKEQMTLFRTYLATGRGRIHGLALAISVALFIVSISLAAAYYGITTGNCPAPHAR
ncbi:hypothetical protein [Rhizobium terrae]|uniref:hypothetical protein n=1 Tax=Rhizobium terrae TaxID=2171756 RepID=UPI000E3E00B9|nr:hypothetical protein [Rhizobium terrae]